MSTALASFVGCMPLFAVIGGFSCLKAEKTAEDYLIAGLLVFLALRGILDSHEGAA